MILVVVLERISIDGDIGFVPESNGLMFAAKLRGTVAPIKSSTVQNAIALASTLPHRGQYWYRLE